MQYFAAQGPSALWSLPSISSLQVENFLIKALIKERSRVWLQKSELKNPVNSSAKPFLKKVDFQDSDIENKIDHSPVCKLKTVYWNNYGKTELCCYGRIGVSKMRWTVVFTKLTKVELSKLSCRENMRKSLSQKTWSFRLRPVRKWSQFSYWRGKCSINNAGDQNSQFWFFGSLVFWCK